MSLDLYYLPFSAPCRGVIITAKALNIELNLKPLNVLTGEQLKPEFLAINPQHTIPTLHDTQTGFSLWESRAIITYLVNRYAPGHAIYPTDPQLRALIDARLNFDIGTLYNNIGKAVFAPAFQGREAPEEDVRTLDEKLTLLNGFLANGYVAGKTVSVADFSIYGSLTLVVAMGSHDLTPFKNIINWFNKITLDYEQRGDNEEALNAVDEIMRAKQDENTRH